jgi:hypothetical protein
MAPVHGKHFTEFSAEYETTIVRARRIVAGFPPLLRGLAEPLLPQLLDGTFSRIVVLLPYWIADLLDKAGSPDRRLLVSRPEQSETLGLANLFGWWSVLMQDWLLDQEQEGLEILPLSMACYATAIGLFERLLAGEESFWTAYEALSLASAEAHCCEWRSHFQTFVGLDDAVLEVDDLDCLADRSALLRLSAVAQLSLYGYGPEDPLHAALQEMLRHYGIGRQIGDDRTDWAEDLQNGRLNYVSTRIARRMKETGVIQDYAELDIERMVGYFLYDDELFADIQNVALAACQEALEILAHYESAYLGAWVDELTERTKRNYEAAVSSRRRLRESLSLRQGAL